MADTPPSVGGSGKGASGAASIIGDNIQQAADKSTTTMIAALAGLLIVGVIVWLISEKK